MQRVDRIVVKLGSSVLTEPRDLELAAARLYHFVREGRSVLAVVSAIGDKTDRLASEARGPGRQGRISCSCRLAGYRRASCGGVSRIDPRAYRSAESPPRARRDRLDRGRPAERCGACRHRRHGRRARVEVGRRADRPGVLRARRTRQDDAPRPRWIRFDPRCTSQPDSAASARCSRTWKGCSTRIPGPRWTVRRRSSNRLAGSAPSPSAAESSSPSRCASPRSSVSPSNLARYSRQIRPASDPSRHASPRLRHQRNENAGSRSRAWEPSEAAWPS